MRFIYTLHESAGAQHVRRDTHAVCEWRSPALCEMQNVLDQANALNNEQPPTFHTIGQALDWMDEHEGWKPAGLRGPAYVRRVSRKEAQEYVNAGAYNLTGLKRREEV